MTLDQRIQKDLNELYNGGATPGDISDALALNGLIKAKPGQTSFATKALPGYYAGDRKSKTVMVMLNPGIDVDIANTSLKCEICKRGMTNAADIQKYHDWCINYGHYDRLRQDPFDLKQAFFLHKWKNTEITLPAGFCTNPKSDIKILLAAKEAVLTQKLQLDFIPYASSSFGHFSKGRIHLVFPFLETILDEIFSHERNYVIFCSKKFEDVFSEYNKSHKINTFNVSSVQNHWKPSNCKITGSCSNVIIRYNGKTMKAMIANTFPHQALSNAYDLMESYGEYCFKNY